MLGLNHKAGILKEIVDDPFIYRSEKKIILRGPDNFQEYHTEVFYASAEVLCVCVCVCNSNLNYVPEVCTCFLFD